MLGHLGARHIRSGQQSEEREARTESAMFLGWAKHYPVALLHNTVCLYLFIISY